MTSKGKVCWITGLAGAGKTTIGRLVYQKLREKYNTVVLLDGDELRMIFGACSGHTYNERKKLASQYAGLCKILRLQGISVICCTIGMIEDVRKWNYENIEGYFEVYVNTPMNILEERDQKGLYSGAKQGTINNVMGIDIKPEFPANPEIEIVNKDIDKINDYVQKIIDHFET